MVFEYYVLLRSILHFKPELRACRTRCRHCGIYFLTDPRNKGRRDLGCPFGCCQAHKSQQSTRRSTAYYREEAGREKKRRLNARRTRRPEPLSEPRVDAHPICPHPLLRYLRVVIRLIEGRPISEGEILRMLARSLRQRRMARRRRIDQLYPSGEPHLFVSRILVRMAG